MRVTSVFFLLATALFSCSDENEVGLEPADVMMVAAHLGDLRAAKGVGLRTAFVARPLEYGPIRKPDLTPDSSVDVEATDFNELAARLGA